MKAVNFLFAVLMSLPALAAETSNRVEFTCSFSEPMKAYTRTVGGRDLVGSGVMQFTLKNIGVDGLDIEYPYEAYGYEAPFQVKTMDDLIVNEDNEDKIRENTPDLVGVWYSLNSGDGGLEGFRNEAGELVYGYDKEQNFVYGLDSDGCDVGTLKLYRNSYNSEPYTKGYLRIEHRCSRFETDKEAKAYSPQEKKLGYPITYVTLSCGKKAL